MTLFKSIYDRFLGKITDDMYFNSEWTKEDTYKDLQNILLDAIPAFEFPRFHLYDYTTSLIVLSENNGELEYDDESYFQDDLTSEEINILAILMMNTWLQRQITSIENTRMKYSGSDFKMTSQANHLAKLINLKTEIEKQNTHMQRLYKRRKILKDNTINSNWSILIENRVIK